MAMAEATTTIITKLKNSYNGENRVWRFVRNATLIVVAGWILRGSTLPAVFADLITGIGFVLLLGNLFLESIEGPSPIKNVLNWTWTLDTFKEEIPQ